jgi:translocator protein
MKMNNTTKFIISVIVPVCAGLIGAIFTTGAIPTWYASLVKPALSPPNWIFAPVWTSLYILMGIAAFLVWRKGLKHKGVKTALALFIGQLVLNLFWSIIFFGLHNAFLAFIEIAALWISIVLTIIYFYKVSKAAGILLLPYIIWVSFASYLSYSIWILN